MRIYVTQFGEPPALPAAVQGGIVAQPGGQGGATPLTALVSIVETIASGTAVRLTIGTDPRRTVLARGGADLTVYPEIGTQIEGYGLNVPCVVPGVANIGAASFVFEPPTVWRVY